MTNQDVLIAEFLLPLQLAGIKCSSDYAHHYNSKRGLHLSLQISILNESFFIDTEIDNFYGRHYKDTHHLMAIIADDFRREYSGRKDHESCIIHDYLAAYVDAYYATDT